MPSDHRNMTQDGVASRMGLYNNSSSQQNRESETGISVDRQYDTGYNGMYEGEISAGRFPPDGQQLLSTLGDHNKIDVFARTCLKTEAVK